MLSCGLLFLGSVICFFGNFLGYLVGSFRVVLRLGYVICGWEVVWLFFIFGNLFFIIY